MRKLFISAAVAAAATIALTACTPPSTDEDALPGSDTAPKNAAAQAVDTSSLEANPGPFPSCKELTEVVGAEIEGMQAKPSNFERRGFVDGLESLTCNWVNPAFVAKGEGKVWISITATSAKINKEAYEGNTEGAADRLIAGDAVSALNGGSYGVTEKLADTDVVTKDGVISVGDGLTITTSVTADEGAADAPTVAEATTAHAALITALYN